MGRAEKPLDPRSGPAAELAAELRALRDAAGRPSYRELAARAGFSTAALSQCRQRTILATCTLAE